MPKLIKQERSVLPIELRPNDQTDANGQATFTITAGQKKGNSKVVFTVEDSKERFIRLLLP